MSERGPRVRVSWTVAERDAAAQKALAAIRSVLKGRSDRWEDWVEVLEGELPALLEGVPEDARSAVAEMVRSVLAAQHEAIPLRSLANAREVLLDYLPAVADAMERVSFSADFQEDQQAIECLWRFIERHHLLADYEGDPGRSFRLVCGEAQRRRGHSLERPQNLELSADARLWVQGELVKAGFSKKAAAFAIGVDPSQGRKLRSDRGKS